MVRFDEAFERARRILKARARDLEGRTVLIRDVQGGISVLTESPKGPRTEELARELSEQLGAFGGDASEVLLFPEDLFDAERIFQSSDARPLFPARLLETGPDNVLLLEREITGLDWMRAPLPVPDSSEGEAPRMTFFGLKGGVGRSTALTLVARALARAGSRVLVFDLDLESPGLGPLLLPRARAPRFGIVDYLVEEAVGQDDEELLANMVATSPLVLDAAGEVLVVPAGGAEGHYLAKLGRAYQPSASKDGVHELAERIDALITGLARREHADVVLIDSRAGLHDLAAFAVTRLRAQSLLFGVATEQTFHGYRLLFEDWRSHPQLASFRDNLRMVAALVPETGRPEYMKRFVESSHEIFLETLYEEASERDSDDVEPFNFDVHDETAPHHPLTIFWNRALQEFDPVSRPEAVPDDQILVASGAFCHRVGELLDREVKP
ncbi:KGGVGR-motif variant AAA ATPase [Chondromyces apiculatus]|uniref:KGGVGR-motif variant AAA ATPase n=1 Tax=Chondromyces apiculatus TaxID=51 RepID=UPI0018CBF327|nr:hypothetical protein [Chondromyces apiculatus]